MLYAKTLYNCESVCRIFFMILGQTAYNQLRTSCERLTQGVCLVVSVSPSLSRCLRLSCWLATHTPPLPTAALLLGTGLNGCHLVCCCLRATQVETSQLLLCCCFTCCVGKLAAVCCMSETSQPVILSAAVCGLLKWNVLQSGLHLLPLRSKYFGNFKTITKGK